jgi:hypothetical protein
VVCLIASCAAILSVVVVRAGAGEPAALGGRAAAPAITWVEFSGTGRSFARVDVIDIFRISQTSPSRAEAFVVRAGKLEHAGIVNDAALDRIRPLLVDWIKVGNDGLLVNAERVTMVRFDATVSANGRRAVVSVTDLFEAGSTAEADEIAKLERLVVP